MNTGYVKLWRKTLKSPVWQNPKLFRFWMWCLMKATHQEWVALVGFQKVPLKAGQFVFGRKKAAVETGLSEQTIRTCLVCLEEMENITIKTTNKFSILTIEKWDLYQGEPDETNHQNNQEATSKQPTTNQQPTTYKNIKNIKHTKNNYSCAFNAFWSAYPKKKDKLKAWQAWQKATIPDDIVSIVERNKTHNRDWVKNGGQYIPYPATWINGQRWEDEIAPAEQSSGLRAAFVGEES